MQRSCANRLDVQPEPLQPDVRRAIAFIDRKAYAHPLQPLRQAQATNPAAYDKNVQRPGCRRRLVRRVHFPPPFLAGIRSRSTFAKAFDALRGRKLASLTAAMMSSTASSIATPVIQSPRFAPLAK